MVIENITRAYWHYRDPKLRMGAAGFSSSADFVSALINLA
jgi:hypothetical protein